jgi:hypothetical protein
VTETAVLLERIKAHATITAVVRSELIVDFGEIPANTLGPVIGVQLIDGLRYSEVSVYRPLMQVSVFAQSRDDAERIARIVETALHRDMWSADGKRLGTVSIGWTVVPDTGWWHVPIDIRMHWH